jgi:hypothetical protein
MDYLLERKVKINRDTKHKSLYSWCLNEFDDKGAIVGRDWVPFGWGFRFTGTSLYVSTKINIKRDDETEKSNASNSKTINGKFSSGVCFDGENLVDVVTFSIFGTARTIKEFSFTINEAKDGDEDACWLAVIPSYESEDASFRKVIEVDFVGFEIYLKSEKFNKLVQLIENRSVDSVGMYTRDIDGVYADWTPTIKTSSAKFLVSDNLIEGVEGNSFEGTVVTRVGDFDISFTTQASLSRKQSLPKVDIDKEFEDDADKFFADNFLTDTDTDDKQIKINLEPVIEVVKSLKTVLWFVFALLLLLLFK